MTDTRAGNPVARASTLGKIYDASPDPVVALDGVSLQVHAGEFLAVCGPSGCGKSTLLLTIGLLLRPDAGKLEIAGQNIAELSRSRQISFRAQNIGFVFQDFHLIPYLNVLENVMVPTLAEPLCNVQDRGEMLLEEMGLTARRDHLPSELSAGERQRTALVRALMLRPRLILADEPTGNLDRDNTDCVLNHLANYTKSGGAVVLATHDERAMMCAERRVFMDKGRIVGSGEVNKR
ncbi:MAG: ABC transporter ATP-binding protein [Verrucomicrobiales bacterium]